MSVDGAREVQVGAGPSRDVVIGWASDGRSLQFTSDRGGVHGNLVDARRRWAGGGSGTPDQVRDQPKVQQSRRDPDRHTDLRHHAGCPQRARGGPRSDFQTGKTLAPPTAITDSYLFNNTQPEWSRDGKKLVFISEHPGRLRSLAVLSLDSGRITEVRPNLTGFARLRWLPDDTILVQGRDLKGRYGFYRIDPTSGDATPVFIGAGVGAAGFAYARWEIPGVSPGHDGGDERRRARSRLRR